MGLKEKSKVNTILAYELKEAGDLNSSVNRFYYSIFQKISNMATAKWNYQHLPSDGSSHESLIKFIETIIEEKKADDSTRLIAFRAMQVKGSFRNLKRLRAQADYFDMDIEEHQMDECITSISTFNSCFSSLSNL